MKKQSKLKLKRAVHRSIKHVKTIILSPRFPLYSIIALLVVLFTLALSSKTMNLTKLSSQKVGKIINPNDNQLRTLPQSNNNQLYDQTVEEVLPKRGFQSRIILKDAILKLVENGVIDKDKFEAIYKERGGLPKELQDVLTKPSNKLIVLTRENANIYVNLLWPLGLSNYMSSNVHSPVNQNLYNYASTGGWNLGQEQNGGAYFNKFKIVDLTPEQEALVTKIAQNTYRPCCDNSTFFQDCNHGSALLGVLQLGAEQGLTEKELYKEALAFNSHWFPQNYIETALFFKIKKNTDWSQVNPQEVLSYNYSAISQWGKNVATEIAKIPNLLPKVQGGGRCST